MVSRHLSALRTAIGQVGGSASLARLLALAHARLYVNTFYLIGSALIAGVGGFGFWVLAARRTTLEAVGITTAIISSAGLLSAIADMGLIAAAIYFAAAQPQRATGFANTAVAAAWAAVGVAAALFVAGSPLWAPALDLLRQDGWLLLLFMGFTLLNHQLMVQDSLILARQRAEFIFWRNVACSLPSIPLLLLMTPQLGGLHGLLAAYTLPNMLVSLAIGQYLLPRLLPGYRALGRLDRSLVGEMLAYSLPTFAANLLWGGAGLLFPLIAINLVGPSSAGSFAMSWALLSLALVLPRSICTSIFVEGSADATQLRRLTDQALQLILVAALPATLLLWVVGPLLLELFGPSYRDEGALRLLVCSIIPFGVNGVAFMALRIRRQLRAAMAYGGLLTAAPGLLAIGFAPHYGALGLAWGWLLGHTAVALAALLWAAQARPRRAQEVSQ